MILAQIEAVVGDIGVDAVKIGMIGGAFAAEQVAARLERLEPSSPDLPIVFDPVMVATSGAALADDATDRRLRPADGRRDDRDAEPARAQAADRARKTRSPPRCTWSASTAARC